MVRELTEQEKFWMGEFGNEYIFRNMGGGSTCGKDSGIYKIS